jgi:hypothetical protein
MKFKNSIFIILTLTFYSCQQEDYFFGEILTPKNINVDYQITGASADSPYGDGSGEVIFTTSADNSLSYKYIIKGVEYLAPSGQKSHLFSDPGVQTYTVSVVAIGSAGVQSTTAINIDVYVEYIPPPDLITMLTSDSQRTWRMKSEAPFHFGLGPFEGEEPFAWYSAGVGEKAYTGMYDDRLIFNIDGSFTHLTNGTVFGFEEYLVPDFGPSDQEANDLGEVDHYPLEDYSEQWSLSGPGGVETLSLTGNAFISFYVGNHTYKILERTPNEMLLQVTESDEGYEWYFRLIAED